MSDITTKPIPASNTSIQNANWSGSIPIVLSLAPTSLSSPAAPRPIHKMISRVNYLHVALHEEIMHFFAYAPLAGLSSAVKSMSVEEPPDSPKKPDEEEGRGKRGEETDDKTEEINFSSADADCAQKKGLSEGTAQTNEESNNKQTPAATSYPKCWFEDEETGVPLRWHLFIGVLYDLMKARSMLNNDSNHQQHTQHNSLPWRIRIHFTSYPTDELLPLDDGLSSQPTKSNNENNNEDDIIYNRITAMVGRIFRQSLKQALFLQNGSSKVAMSITKSSHEQIWKAVLQTNYNSYHDVNIDLQSGINAPSIGSESTTDVPMTRENKDEKQKGYIPKLIPVRLMLNGMPSIQKPTKHMKDDIDTTKKKRPTEVLAELGTYQAPHYTTLGDLLSDWLPDHYAIDPITNCAASISAELAVQYSIQGVQPSMKCAMVDLWRALSHPDHFLYIIVVTK